MKSAVAKDLTERHEPIVRLEPGKRRALPIGKVAARNVKRLIGEISEEYKDGKRPWGWKAYVARRMGISETMVQWIDSGRITSIGLDALEKISIETRCPVEVLMERRARR